MSQANRQYLYGHRSKDRTKIIRPSGTGFPTIQDIRAERQRREYLRKMHIEELSREEVRESCKSLSNFVLHAWNVLEPVHEYKHGWHIDFICKHLEAITYNLFQEEGYSPRLLINEPPGTMKSSLLNIYWTAWEWGPANKPSMMNIATSYKETNCTRDCEKLGYLIQSDWYQKHWPHVDLVRESGHYLQTSKRGEYRAIPFGSLTQFRADRVKIDDPHSIDTAESDADRARAIIRFRESVPSRVNDPVNSAIILIMQRLHQQDLSGVAIDGNLGYMNVCLPMEYEPDRKCRTPFGEDPRTEPGELLFPARFPRQVVERDKMVMREYATAGQFQQRPAPREGGMFKKHWFKIVNAAPSTIRKHQVRKWDLAASVPKATTDPDHTVGLRMGKCPDGNYYIDDVQRMRDTAQRVRVAIQTMATHDGETCHILVPQDPGQAGKDQSESIIRENAGFRVYAEVERGDKATRAEPFAAQCEAGNVYLVKGPWVDSFIDELCNFPTGHDDQVDAAAGAFNYLARKNPVIVTTEMLNKVRMSIPTPRMRRH